MAQAQFRSAAMMHEESEMVDGYMDGLDPDSPEPSENRSLSYRHGFRNGRDDLAHSPRASAQALREEAAACIEADNAQAIPASPKGR